MNPQNVPPCASTISRRLKLPGEDEHSDQGEAERHFIADHLGAGSQSAEQGILAVGRPARQSNAIDTHRCNAQDNEQSNVDIGDLEWRAYTSYGYPVADGDHRDRGQRESDCNYGRCKIQQFVDVRRSDVFFKNEFDAIGQRLQQPKGADPRGSPAVLNMTHNFALQPYGVSDRGEQHEKCDRSLDD